MLIAAIIIVTLLINYLSYRLFYIRSLHKMLALSVFCAQLLWYTVPALFWILFPDLLTLLPYTSRLTRDELFEAYLVEAAVILLVLILVFQLRIFGENSKARPDTEITCSRETKNFILLLAAAIMVYVLTVASMDYVDINAMDVVYGSEREYLFSKLVGFFYGLSIIAVITLYVFEKRDKLVMMFSFALILIYTAIFLASGSRIWALLPMIVYVFKKLFENRGLSRGVVKQIIMVCLYIVAVMPLIVLIGKSRTGIAPFELSLENYYGQYADYQAVEAVMEKLDSFSTGALLVKNFGKGGGGYKPYLGAILVFVPRYFVPDRPVSGSADGTYAGHPTRLVPASENIGYYSESQNVGVSPVHVAIWHFGLPGILLFIISTLVYFWIINEMLSSRYLLKKIIGVYMLSIPTFSTVIPSPDVALKNMVVTLFLLVFAELLRTTFLLKRDIPATV